MFRLVNILPDKYFHDCHITGSINVPLDQLKEVAQNWDRQDMIVLYGSHAACVLSSRAWHLLHDIGFKNCLLFEGGTAQWYQKGFACVGPASMEMWHSDHKSITTNLPTIGLQELHNELINQGLI